MTLKKLNYSVAICALARDCASSLKNNIPQVEQLRALFQSSCVVIVENDSKDSTKEILKQWSKKSAGVTIISQNFNSLTLPPATNSNPYPGTSMQRIGKMATYRNIYLDWIDKNDKKFDLVIMVDIDIESFSAEDVIDALSFAPENWGGIFANGYTDTKLFGKEIYRMFHDMYAYAENLPIEKPYFINGKQFELKKKLNKKLSSNKYLSVISAFGGLGIYKYDAISGLRYRAEKNGDKYMEAVCEHVMFNKQVIEKGYANYICNSLKVYYGRSEMLMTIRNILPLWFFKILCLLIRFRSLKE